MECLTKRDVGMLSTIESVNSSSKPLQTVRLGRQPLLRGLQIYDLNLRETAVDAGSVSLRRLGLWFNPWLVRAHTGRGKPVCVLHFFCGGRWVKHDGLGIVVSRAVCQYAEKNKGEKNV